MKVKIIFLLIATLLFSCIEKDDNVVRIGLLNGPSSIGMVNSIDKVKYHDGKQIHYQIKDNPQHLRALFQSGNLEMAILPMTMVYSMIENDVDVNIFAITGWGNLYLLGRDSLQNISNLSGMSISVPGEGQTPDLVTKFLLKENLLEEDINLNYTYPAPLLLASALAVGKVKYAILPEPLASLAISKDSTLIRALDIAEVWKNTLPDIPLIQSVFVVHKEFYNKNKAWCSSFLPELKINADAVRETPELALELATKHKLLPNHLIDTAIITNSKLDFCYSDSMDNKIYKYLEVFCDIDDSLIISEFIVSNIE